MDECKLNLYLIWIALLSLLLITIFFHAYALRELNEMDFKLTYMINDLEFIQQKRP